MERWNGSGDEVLESIGNLKFLLANNKSLPSVMKIIHEAQAYLASLGTDQWQDGYPQEEVIREDISNRESYIVSGDGGKVSATAMLTTRAEPTYMIIEGEWLTGDDVAYGVIHRMAVGIDFRGQGIAKFILKESENILQSQQVGSMRIDTHEDNSGMQGLLRQAGYSYCGVIFLADGAKRLAYEKLIES
jgi:ribosomal protein S18 acetylase RimI-like enzyme